MKYISKEKLIKDLRAAYVDGVFRIFISILLILLNIFTFLGFYSILTRGLLSRRNRTFIQGLQEEPRSILFFLLVILFFIASIFFFMSGVKFFQSGKYPPSLQKWKEGIRYSSFFWLILSLGILFIIFFTIIMS